MKLLDRIMPKSKTAVINYVILLLVIVEMILTFVPSISFVAEHRQFVTDSEGNFEIIEDNVDVSTSLQNYLWFPTTGNNKLNVALTERLERIDSLRRLEQSEQVPDSSALLNALSQQTAWEEDLIALSEKEQKEAEANAPEEESEATDATEAPEVIYYPEEWKEVGENWIQLKTSGQLSEIDKLTAELQEIKATPRSGYAINDFTLFPVLLVVASIVFFIVCIAFGGRVSATVLAALWSIIGLGACYANNILFAMQNTFSIQRALILVVAILTIINSLLTAKHSKPKKIQA